jgi:hypothetical protein
MASNPGENVLTFLCLSLQTHEIVPLSRYAEVVAMHPTNGVFWKAIEPVLTVVMVVIVLYLGATAVGFLT